MNISIQHGSVTSSTSFVYQEKAQFKSPQKPQPPQHAVTPRVDRGNELVHSVSFYRRMQNAVRLSIVFILHNTAALQRELV